MKNLLRFVSVLLVLAGLNSILVAQPQYYNFNTGTGSNSFPFNVAGGKMVQSLFIAGSFSNPTPAPAGTITSIFVRLSTAMVNRVYTDLTIKMGQSTITDLTSGAFYTGTLTTVYYRASVTINNPIEWLEFILDTPFAYDPTQSLIVEMGQCGATGSGGSVRNTTTTGIKRVWSVGGCPFAPYASGDAGTLNFGFTLGAAGGPPAVVTTAATAVTSTTATLNGTVNANLATTTVSFEYGLTTAYGSTVAGVPATVSGNTVTPVSANITGLVPGTLYHYRVKGNNSFGNTNGLDMTFTTLALLPTVVTTAATGVGSTTATLNGTVDAGGASTTVTFEYGLTTAYGTTVSGVPGTVTGNTPTPVSANLTGLTLNTTYHYRVKGVNSVGTSNGLDMTFLTTNCPMPGAPGTISGTTSGCGNTSGNVYSVSPISNATGYTWAVPPGALITAGANTNSITVTFGNTSGTVSVFGTNTCGNGPTASLAVTINTAPVPTITGQTQMCVNSGYYDYVTQPGMTNYIWTVSPGGLITWGQGTNQAQVTWTVGGPQTISVNYTSVNGCPGAVPTVFPVTVTALPGPAGAITGTSTACAGSAGNSYTVSPVAGALTYVWTLPAGATISSGAGTNTIAVDFGTTAVSGNVTVYGNNLCGNGTVSPPYAVTVNPLPGDAGLITGDPQVCNGDLGVAYSVAAVTNATGYAWTLPSGATIASGTNTSSITVDFGASAASGVIKVNGTNSCGNGIASPDFEVTVNPVPPAPVITASGESLESSAPEGNQWYFNGTAIPGATGPTYTPTQSGEHWCVVTLNGCSSAESNHVMWVMTGMDPLQPASVLVKPVPSDGRFTVTITAPAPDIYSIRVYNAVGVMTHEYTGIGVNGTTEKAIDLRPVPDGVYTLVILNSRTQTVRRIIVNK